jgi:photosystem II stability/assembly factor-like uncharacterized protein
MVWLYCFVLAAVMVVTIVKPASADTLDNWHYRLTGQQLNKVTYGDGTFIAVGNGVMATSTDGATWVFSTPPTANNLNGIAYGNGKFIAVGNSGTILTSTDAASWSMLTPVTNQNLMNVKYCTGLTGGSIFVIVGDNGTILTSSDGVTWAALRCGSMVLLRVWMLRRF